MTDRIISISDKIAGVAGSLVKVPIILSDASDITTIDLQIQFNNQLLELASPNANITRGNITDNWSSFLTGVVSNGNTSTIILNTFNIEPSFTGIGTIATINFTVKSNASVDTISVLKIENAILGDSFGSNFNKILDAGVFTVSQSFPNSPPIFVNAISEQNINQDSQFNFQIPTNTFVDNDNENLIYSANLINGNTLKNLPSWLSFNGQTGTFSGIPSNNDVGSFDIKIKAADGQGATAETTFKVTVINVNDAPELVKPIPDTSIIINNNLNLIIPNDTFQDIDGDELTYFATLEDGNSLPNWLSFDAETLTFFGIPTLNNVGEITIKLAAVDPSEDKLSDTFNLKVIPFNSPPIISNPIPNGTTKENETFILDIPNTVFSDPDYDILTYSASLENGNNLPSWLTFNPDNRRFFGTPENEDVGTLSIKLTVDDGNGGQVSNIFNLTIENVNDAPKLANPIPNQITEEDSLVNFQIPTNTFIDPDGDILSYSATLADGSNLPDWLSFHPDELLFSGTPLNRSNVGTINLKVTAQDPSLAQVSHIFQLTITPFAWDLNDDNMVSATDLIFVLNRLGQAVSLNNNQLADVNGDGMIDQLDVIAVNSRLGYQVIDKR